ncbi:MAG: DNA glycosylase [Taibaiella sp.]|jgi:DNA-3-methyladenine glycosylase II
MNKLRSFVIPVDSLFNFKECLWFLNRDFDDCMHTIEGNTVVKALEVEGRPYLFRISDNGVGLKVDILEGEYTPALEQAIVRFIDEWFDLGRNLQPFYRLLEKDKKLAYMTEEYKGLRLIGIPDLFEALCWSIIGQQINLTFAYRLKRRLVENYGRSIVYGGNNYHLFPEPNALAKADITELWDMQYSQKKAEYIIGIAEIFKEGLVSKTILQDLTSFAAQQQALTAIRGIGIWTANYALMKSLRISGAIPYGDVGLLQALVNHGLIKDRKDQVGIDRLFKKVKGWESYLVFYLWRSLSQPSND